MFSKFLKRRENSKNRLKYWKNYTYFSCNFQQINSDENSSIFFTFLQSFTQLLKNFTNFQLIFLFFMSSLYNFYSNTNDFSRIISIYKKNSKVFEAILLICSFVFEWASAILIEIWTIFLKFWGTFYDRYFKQFTFFFNHFITVLFFRLFYCSYILNNFHHIFKKISDISINFINFKSSVWILYRKISIFFTIWRVLSNAILNR